MSEKSSGEGIALNWRGPLLTAAIFAATFALLLLIAHQNQSNTSDIGSSLREDPYGTSLLFDSYQKAGYQVKRSQDEDSLADQDAQKTTAFFIGGYPSSDWKMQMGRAGVGEKFRSRVERFLARGGRVVLVAPSGKVKSESQGWEVGRKYYETPQDSEPIWISAEPGAMPAGSEDMYLGADAPWLQTDVAWTTLYASPADAGNNEGRHAHMAMRQVANGELIAASQQSFLLNEAIKTHPNPALLDFLVDGRPVIWVDETLHGLQQDEGVLWLVHRYRLQVALLLFWATLLILLWSISGDLIRRPTHSQVAQIVRHGKGPGVAARRLLQRSIAREQVVTECWEEFRRRSPQDAQSISADPHWGPRLRAARAESPLVGYRQLGELIAERRASARGLARRESWALKNSIASLKTDLEEARTR
jgi:hypothetical protein